MLRRSSTPKPILLDAGNITTLAGAEGFQIVTPRN
jgi:hypothetical protein